MYYTSKQENVVRFPMRQLPKRNQMTLELTTTCISIATRPLTMSKTNTRL